MLTLLPPRIARATSGHAAAFENGAISEHVPWRDSDGNVINAHDGGIIYVNGMYHWYGLALRPKPAVSGPDGGQKTTVGVVMYRSPDLHRWAYEGVVLACSHDPKNPLYAPMRFERPKILYDERTKQYVMWFHFVSYPGDHGNKPTQGEAGVATCSSVNGTYTYRGTMRPLGEDGIVRDLTVFQDDDGSAYLIYDRDVRIKGPGYGRVLHIVKLTDDYLGCTKTYFKIANAARREAPVMIKRNGFYYLITSGMSGWKFNESNYYRAKNILGPYTEMGDPFIGAGRETTFQAQGTDAFAVAGRPAEFILMLERHNVANMVESSYIWLPVHFTPDGGIEIRYLPSWLTD
ncbi:MAG TPA: family 43 glycosylhydrolase [Opitutaceae bacterium]|nr:family 43 glycosylhydrolase [Opitutaceae bacterium]